MAFDLVTEQSDFIFCVVYCNYCLLYVHVCVVLLLISDKVCGYEVLYERRWQTDAQGKQISQEMAGRAKVGV